MLAGIERAAQPARLLRDPRGGIRRREMHPGREALVERRRRLPVGGELKALAGCDLLLRRECAHQAHAALEIYVGRGGAGRDDLAIRRVKRRVD